jgi:methenyltetrahydromethanopterin cyclohydrolase
MVLDANKGPAMTLNEDALLLADVMTQSPSMRTAVHNIAGARVVDCGIQTAGGLQAGLHLARVCMAGRGDVALMVGSVDGLDGPMIHVQSDDPVRACLAAQYAGWQVSVGKYFAMGSGPMRAIYGKEELYEHIPGRESSPVAVGVLETRKLPSEEVIAFLSDRLALSSDKVTLLAAPTASLAGTVQVVARSLETALHKLHELKFDVDHVKSGFGTAPLPPPAKDDLAAIGRTNDGILYGGRVHLWVNGNDDQIAAVGPQVPASASRDYGLPFADLFARYNHDFYKIDPLLFSPAVVVFHNLASGRTFTFGRYAGDVLRKSFGY